MGATILNIVRKDTPRVDPQRCGDVISFRQLKLFESVGRLQSVRRGSEECNLTQPAVTQALAKLEQQIGVFVLERRARGSYLTEAGAILYRRVCNMFDQIERALIELGVPEGNGQAAAIANRLTRSQIRSLVAIIETGSFASAAEKLGLTQASLQRAARDLESNLRQPIYLRTTADVIVTPTGIEFGRKMKLALQEVEWGAAEIRTAMGAGRSKIVVGALPFGGSFLLATVLEEFLGTHPSVDLRIVTEGASEMLECLRAGQVDMVIGLLPETTATDLSHQILCTTPYCIVARAGHPLARKDHVTLSDLTEHDWIVGAEGSNRRNYFDALFKEQAAPHVSIATSSMPIIRHLIESSDRLTLMTSYELQHEGRQFVALPFGSIHPVPAIGVTMRNGWMCTGLHEDFIALLRRRVAVSKSFTIHSAAS